MLLGGDEFGRTKKGNNNAYCQDNSVSWVDWKLLQKNREFFEYVNVQDEILKIYFSEKILDCTY